MVAPYDMLSRPAPVDCSVRGHDGHQRPRAALRSLIGIAEAWMLFVLGAMIGVGVACGCPGPASELGSVYDIETVLPGWEPDSGKVLIEDDDLLIVYRDGDGAEWELVYELYPD